MEAVALVTFVAAAEEGPEGVGAVSEHVARPVLALVVVRHVAALQGQVIGRCYLNYILHLVIQNI